MPTTRLKYLDGLRGIFALTVALSHFFGSQYGWHDYPFQNAYISVDFFFILSGFVLSHVYGQALSSGLMNDRKFIFYRFARMYPLHIVTMVVVGIIYLLTQRAFPFDEPFFSGIANIFLLQNMGFVSNWSWNDPSWSISAEFWVSVFLVPWCIRRVKTNQLLFIALMCYTVLYTSFGSLMVAHEMMYGIVTSGFVRCIAGVTLGIAVCRMVQGMGQTGLNHMQKSIIGCLDMILFAAVVYLVYQKTPIGKLSFLPIPLVALLMLSLATLNSWFNKIIGSRIPVWLGDISYSVYLIHTPIILVMGSVLAPLNLPFAVKFTVFLTLTLVLSHLTHRFFEKPCYEWLKKRFSGQVQSNMNELKTEKKFVTQR
ncbi:acyltransferase family protein [Serratia quinivorans]|uniref:acyltransferase family protein n=1 Tax=Serratia quinivorans TaxID=137545 RepID=UPI00217C9306|nr:acyltransferase [Serratia quinivorans]CAI1131472.1 glucans biosynthesis protein [Serratia quinivorans]